MQINNKENLKNFDIDYQKSENQQIIKWRNKLLSLTAILSSPIACELEDYCECGMCEIEKMIEEMSKYENE